MTPTRTVLWLSLLGLLGVAWLMPLAQGTEARDELSSTMTSPTVSPSAWARGARMYLEGRLSDGTPLTARIAESLTVSGTSFTCVHCHLKSGYGAAESAVVVRPVTGPRLFAPLNQAAPQNQVEALPEGMRRPPLRPAYSTASLIDAIRLGRDPSGRPLHPLMPRYSLTDAQAEDLVAYLTQLSATPSPAVSAEQLRLALLTHEDAPPEQASALRSTLEALIADHNIESRHERERARTGAFHMRAMSAGWRAWEVVHWRLGGPPDTWDAQLQAQLEQQPVFALLGALVPGDHSPLAAFADRHKLPSLMPVTRLPAAHAASGYTLYLEGGYAQEGARLARYLTRIPGQSPLASSARILTLLDARPEALALQRGFADAWAQSGKPPPRVLTWQEGSPPPVLPRADVLLVALQPEKACQVLAPLSSRLLLPRAILLPGGLWAGTRTAGNQGGLESALALPPPPACLPERVRAKVIMTWPWSLPWEAGARVVALDTWLERHGLPRDQLHVRAQAFFTVRLLEVALKAIREEFYPDYLLDRIDMMSDETYGLATLPRLSFGPGQRTASKGCQLLRLKSARTRAEHAGSAWERVPGTGWVY